MSEENKATQLPARRNSAEKNRKMKERAVWNSKEMMEFRAQMREGFKVDVRDRAKFDPGSDDWSWAKFKAKCMRETNSASANVQLLRAGVQTAVNNMYPSIQTTYEEWAHVIHSTKDTELYAPLNAMSFLSELGEGEKYPESNVVGLDIKLRNKKFGEMFPVTMELIEDDQTGQFQQKVGDMSEYAALAWEVYAYGKLASITAGCTYGNLTVPASETKPSSESTYPWNSSGFSVGGGINAISAAAMTQGNVQTVFTLLENMLNLQGLKMATNPDSIICSPFYRWTLATLLNSNFYPSGAAATGAVGGNMATNVLQGIAKPVISRFVFDNNGACNNSKAWYVLDTSKPFFIVQIREGATVEQEATNAGASFERDVMRWKLRVRGNADFIEPRGFARGSDGSA